MFDNTRPLAPTHPTRLSALFSDVLGEYAGKDVTVGTLMATFQKRGFGVLLVLFALPLCIPMPPPVDTVLGIPLFYLCIQMILGRETPSLPKKITNKVISGDLLIKAFTRARPYLEKFEKMFKPRLTNILSDRARARVCGFLGVGLTCSVLIPFPLSNTVPSLCMVVMAMGLMAHDSLAALAAGLFGTLWVIGLCFIVIYGVQFLGGLFL